MSVITHPDGTQIAAGPAGHTTITHADGTLRVIHPDGRMVITHTDGTEITTVDHAVTKTELQADGSWRTTTTTTVKPAPVDRKAFLQANYPKTISDVSKEWLSELLQKKLTAHSVLKVLDAGVTSDAAIFALEYAAGESGPASICLKYAKETESNREFAMGANMYAKELFFFNNICQAVAAVMTIPETIGVFIDDEKPDEFYCIAMEDLNLKNDSIDQIEGVTIEDCKKLGSMAARFHAAFWEHALLKDDVVCAGKR